MKQTGVSLLLVTFAVLLLSGGTVWAGAASEPEEEASATMVAAGKYNEAPMLTKLVAAGTGLVASGSLKRSVSVCPFTVWARRCGPSSCGRPSVSREGGPLPSALVAMTRTE